VSVLRSPGRHALTSGGSLAVTKTSLAVTQTSLAVTQTSLAVTLYSPHKLPWLSHTDFSSHTDTPLAVTHRLIGHADRGSHAYTATV
jgi:hypothetical protein